MVRAEQERERLRGQAGDLEEFLRGLRLKASVEPLGLATLPRAAQLCQRTNQFNLTLRRHDQATLASLLEAGGVGLTMRVADRLGDAGLVGFALACPRGAGGEWELDTLVLSCRVIGRRVETVLLAELLEEVARRGGRAVHASHVRGPRNEVCRGYLGEHGFTALPDQPEPGCARYRLDLDHARPTAPEYIEVIRRTP
jgi:FkbH-like protein